MTHEPMTYGPKRGQRAGVALLAALTSVTIIACGVVYAPASVLTMQLLGAR